MQNHIIRLFQRDKLFKYIALIITSVVFYLSLKPPNPDNKTWNFFFIRGDLFLHFLCYFILSIVYYIAFYTKEKTTKKSLLLSVFIGSLLEILQIIPFFRRTFDVQDLIANCLGAGIGVISIRLLFPDSAKE